MRGVRWAEGSVQVARVAGDETGGALKVVLEP